MQTTHTRSPDTDGAPTPEKVGAGDMLLAGFRSLGIEDGPRQELTVKLRPGSVVAEVPDRPSRPSMRLWPLGR